MRDGTGGKEGGGDLDDGMTTKTVFHNRAVEMPVAQHNAVSPITVLFSVICFSRRKRKTD